jgi:hypothetical protein
MFKPLSGARKARRGRSKAAGWVPIIPVPEGVAPPPETHFKHDKPTAVYAYRGPDGRLWGYISRFDLEDGNKEFWPRTFCRKLGVEDPEWRWKGFDVPRPLYNLDHLSAAAKETPIIICEGEGCADAAGELLPDYVAITSPGGSNAARKADWIATSGRRVVIWPDADEAGRKYAAEVAGLVAKAGAAPVTMVTPPKDVKSGWDLADALAEGWTPERVLALIETARPAAEVKRGGDGGGAGDGDGVGDGGVAHNDIDQKGKNPRRPRPADLLDAAGEIELWHTPTGDAWATVYNGRGYANFAIDDPRFEIWLINQWRVNGYDAPGREGMGKVLATLRASAIYDGKEHKTHIRVAGSLDHEVYIDLGGADWKALKLSPAGPAVMERPPVKFRRGSGTQALPMPDESGSVDGVWDWFNCQSDDDRVLLLTWLLSAMRPHGPYPMLVLTGPPGAAKTTTAKFARRLLDPNIVLVSAIPIDERDLSPAIPNSWVLGFDNISKVSARLSDRLCMIATGSGIRERLLHTNTGEVLIEACRPIVLNGIGDLTTRTDLADRSVLVSLEPPACRRAEFTDTTAGKSLESEFKAALPGLLGGLYSVFCAAMRVYLDGMDPPNGNPRMVDFAIWGNAVGKAMGWAPNAFDEAYSGNRLETDQIALEDCPVWGPLQIVFPTGRDEWVGTATDLKRKILDAIDSAEKRKKFHAMPPSSYAQHLQRIAPLLNKLGWVVHKKSRSSRKGRRWHVMPPADHDR